MKKFLLLSNYAPKPGFKYPEVDCPLAHREQAHERIYALDRFWPEGVLWQTLRAEDMTYEALTETIGKGDWDAIWLSGSPYLLEEASNHPWIESMQKMSATLITENQTPVIGLCFGLQLLATAAGGSVKKTQGYQKGEKNILTAAGEPMIKTRVYHENYVTDLPSAAEVLGKTECGMPYLVKFGEKVLGVQSHPECALEDVQESQKAENFWGQQFRALIQ